MSLYSKLKMLEKAEEDSLKTTHPDRYSVLLQETQVELLKSILEQLQTNTAPQTKTQGVEAKQAEMPNLRRKMLLKPISNNSTGIDVIIDDGGIAKYPKVPNDSFIPEVGGAPENG